jgi:hypothetical protein
LILADDPKLADDMQVADSWYWAYTNKIKLQGKDFQLEGHEYQPGLMQCGSRIKVMRKAAQMTFTESEVLSVLHGLIHDYYPTGVLYLFPTADDVSDFSKSRFAPLIQDNPYVIGRFIQNTDSASIKRISSGMLYLRGARSTSKVRGIKADSSKLRSIPVDKVVFDERDLMSDEMVDMAIERMSHSEIQEQVHLGTPTIPDWGIDALYKESDQRVWMIRCDKCREYTCLELEFPHCIKFKKDKAYRACKKCGSEIFTRDGEWVSQFESDIAGFWISQLNSHYIDPGEILRLYDNPPHGNIQEVYNSKLGMPYIATEDRLTQQDVYECMGSDSMLTRDVGPCAMGSDIGKTNHVVIGKKHHGRLKIVYINRISGFNDLHDLAQRFGVTSACLDLYPETRKVREFQKSEKIRVFGVQYRDQMKDGWRRDDSQGVITVARTEICDATHRLITKREVELPRRGGEMETFAKQLTGIAKVLVEDEETGSRVYRYRRVGTYGDHYRHALNYFWLAAQSIPSYVDPIAVKRDIEMSNYDPLTIGLGVTR